jgi:DNA polymerase III subunit delta'
MAWQNILGHDEVVERFRRALAADRLASTFLFVGPEGIGKRAFALRLAQTLLCEVRDAKFLDPCGKCPGCLQTLAGTHPDLISVRRPAGKSFIPLGLLKGDEPEYPVRDSLLCALAMRPFRGGRKVAIIDDADFLNLEGANCLLKTLEEPPPQSVLILLGTSIERQLPTIRSRAQIVRFAPLSSSLVAQLLIDQQLLSNPQDAERLGKLSGGSLTRAAELNDEQLWKFRVELLSRLAQSPLHSVGLAQLVSKFVDEAGKEAPLRRARLRLVIGFAAEFFHELARQLVGLQNLSDPELAAVIDRASRSNAWDAELATQAAQRSLEAIAQIDRNANQSTLIEAWLDELLTMNRQSATASGLASARS